MGNGNAVLSNFRHCCPKMGRRANARTKGLLVIPDPTISDIHLKKSNMSEVVFQEAKDGTRSYPKGFGIYSPFGGSKRGPKWA